MIPRHVRSDACGQSRRSKNNVRVSCLNQLDQPKEAFLCAHARLTTPVNTHLTECAVSRPLVRTEKRLEDSFSYWKRQPGREECHRECVDFCDISAFPQGRPLVQTKEKC